MLLRLLAALLGRRGLVGRVSRRRLALHRRGLLRHDDRRGGEQRQREERATNHERVPPEGRARATLARFNGETRHRTAASRAPAWCHGVGKFHSVTSLPGASRRWRPSLGAPRPPAARPARPGGGGRNAPPPARHGERPFPGGPPPCPAHTA